MAVAVRCVGLADACGSPEGLEVGHLKVCLEPQALASVPEMIYFLLFYDPLTSLFASKRQWKRLNV